MSPHRFVRLLLATCAIFLVPPAVLAQSGYVFTKIIDNQTNRPDGLGNFYIGTPDSFPSLDGNTVVFQDITNSANSIWSANASGGGLVKLADFQTAVPGGVGNFTRFDDQIARVKDGLVFFEGLDSLLNNGCHGGLYTIPAGGGTISRIIDYHTAAPAAAGNFTQSNANNQITDGSSAGDFDCEAGSIVFHGVTNSNGDGIYSVKVDGTALTRLADKFTPGTPEPFPVGQYYSAALHNQTAVFYGATVFNGYGVFSSPVTGGLSSPVELASPYTPLPGGQSPEMTTVYYTGFSRFDHVTGDLVFAAHDGSGVNGLYALPAESLGGGVFKKIVDNRTSLPGSSVPASYFDGTPFSTDSGQVAFVTAENESAGQTEALYVTNADGTITRVIGAGDVLDGISLVGITLGSHALSGGRIAFGAGSYLQGHDGNARYGAIFVATPMAQTADLALTVAASTGTVAIGQDVTYTVNVVNRGPAAASAILVDTLPTGTSFVSATNGSTTTGHSVTLSTDALAVGANMSFDVVVRATVGGTLMNSVNVSSTTPDPDLSNNTAQTVVNSVDVPTVTVAATGDGDAVEGGEAGKAVIRRTGDTTTALKIRYKIKGSAKSGVDYKALSGVATIPAGAVQTKIQLKPINNRVINGARVAKIKLLPSSDGSYHLGSPGAAKIKIIDND